jgi:hypothetical protein
VGLGHGPADRQAQAAGLAGPGRSVALLEGIEDLGEQIGLDADAGVLDLDHQVRPARVDFVAGTDRDHAAGGGELDGVLDQVPEDMLQPSGVGVEVVVSGAQVQGQADFNFTGLDVAVADLRRIMGDDRIASTALAPAIIVAFGPGAGALRTHPVDPPMRTDRWPQGMLSIVPSP